MDQPSPESIDLSKSHVFRLAELPAHKNPNGSESWNVVHGRLPTGEQIALHVSMQSAGTVPNPARACRVLASLAHPFAPTPPGTVCSEIALGPQQAVVTGVLHGRRIHAQLDVRGSCQIERWRRVAAVAPGFPRTS